MGYDISKIKNGNLKAVAEAANIIDGNKQELNDKEFEIFKTASIGARLISEEDFNKEILGLDITVTPKATDPIKPERKVETSAQPSLEDASRKDLRNRRNRVEDSIRICAENGGKIDGLMEALRDTFRSGEYAAILNDVEEVLTLVQETNYSSKKDVNKIKKNVLKSFEPKNQFQRDILDLAVTMVKNEQIDFQYNALVKMYENLKSQNPNANYTELVDKVTDTMYEINPIGGRVPKKEFYAEEVTAKFLEYVQNDVKTYVDYSLANSDSTKRHGVRKDAKADIVKGDIVRKEVLKDSKDEVAIIARRNKAEKRAEELKSISAAELKDVLGYQLYMDLEQSYLMDCKNSDGTYDVSELSEAIIYRIGSDYLLNQSDNTEEAEKHNTIVELREKTGLRNLDWNDTKKILKLCKIERERNDRGIATIAEAAGLSGLSHALTAYMATTVVDVHQKVVINIDSKEVAQSIAKDLEKNGVKHEMIADNKGGFKLRVLQDVFYDPTVMNLLKGLGTGVLQGAILGIIFGQGKDFEKAAISIEDFDFSNPRYTDLEQYKEYVRNRYPEAKANAIIALALTMKDENGKFDPAQFDSALKNIAGVGSNLNPQEWNGHRLNDLRGRDASYLNDSERRLLVEVTTPTINTEKPELKAQQLAEFQKVVTKEQTPDYIRKYKDTWSFIVRTYYPEAVAKLGEKAVVRELKKLWNVPATDNELPKQEVLPTEILGYQKGTPDEETINANRAKYAWGGTGYDSRVQNYKSGEYGAEATNLSTRAHGKGDTIDEAVEQVVPTQVNTKTTVRIYNPDGSLREIREIVNN